MSKKTVGDFIVERLVEWGVKRIYGYPGDGINGLMGALERQTEDIDFIQARHEELAAFMACAHAKFTGEVGVCLATSGPGAIHLLNGLYDAKKDHQPVVAIVGPAGPRGPGRRLPAGGGPHRPCSRTWRTTTCHHALDARADAPPGGPGHAHRQGRAPGDVPHLPQRRPGDGVRGAAQEPRDGPLQRGREPAPGGPEGRGPEAGRRRAERGREGGHAGGRRRPGRHRRGDGGGRPSWAPAWPRPCWARRRWTTACPA